MEPLFEQLVDHPDDLERHLVVADALQLRGDRRGELIAIQARLAAGLVDETVRARERELIAAAEAEMFEKLPDGGVEITWHLGFVRRVEIEANAIGEVAERKWLTSHPCLELVREVLLCSGRGPVLLRDRDRPFRSSLEILYGARSPTAIERVALGDRFQAPPSRDILSELVERFPRLTALEICADEVPVLAPLDRLRSLALWVGLARSKVLGDIARAHLPLLERLAIGFTATAPGGTADQLIESLAPILDGLEYPSLAHVAIMHAGIEDALIDALPQRKLLPRLASLGLTWTRLTRAGEEALVRSKAAFANVQLVWPRPAGERANAAMRFRMATLLRLQLDRPIDALPHYEGAVASAPEAVNYLFGLGSVLGNLDRHDEQIATFDRALAIDPNHASVLYNRGRALAELGRIHEAIDSLHRAVTANPRHLDAWQILGDLYRRLGRVDEAVRCYRTITETDPTHDGGGHEIDALLECDRGDAALAAAQLHCEAHPDDAQLQRKLARVHLRLGRPGDALAIAERLQVHEPEHHYTRFLALAALRDLGRIDEALAIADVIATSKEPPYAWVGRIQRALLSDTDLVEAADQARVIDPTVAANASSPLDPAGSPGDRTRARLPESSLQSHVLALAAAVLRRDRACASRVRAEIDRLLATQLRGFALDRRWDIGDTLDQVARRADPELATLLRTTYAIVTGRAPRP